MGTTIRRLMAVVILFTIHCSLFTSLAVAQDTSRRYDNFFLEAIVQREKGNSDAAFDLLRHCVDIDSTRSEAYFYLAQYYGALKQKDKMLGMMKKAVDLEPDNTTYLETWTWSPITPPISRRWLIFISRAVNTRKASICWNACMTRVVSAMKC